MAPRSTERELTPEESRVLKLLHGWEKCCDEHRNIQTLWIPKEALDTLRRTNVARPAKKTKYDEKRKLYQVTFTLPEFYKYITLCCELVGFTINIDGSITTKDHLTITSAEIH